MVIKAVLDTTNVFFIFVISDHFGVIDHQLYNMHKGKRVTFICNNVNFLHGMFSQSTLCWCIYANHHIYNMHWSQGEWKQNQTKILKDQIFENPLLRSGVWILSLGNKITIRQVTYFHVISIMLTSRSDDPTLQSSPDHQLLCAVPFLYHCCSVFIKVQSMNVRALCHRFMQR